MALFVALLFTSTALLAQNMNAQQSTTGKHRPQNVSKGIVAKETTKSQILIANVPSYLWQHGCGPTALGMVVGYYDGLGFSDLIDGDAANQNNNVNDVIANNTHYNDYALPIDTYPELYQDKSELGNAHESNCVADFMQTSWSSEENRYGWSWSNMIGQAFINYINQQNNSYITETSYEIFSANSWDVYMNEINNNRPVVLLVDTNGDGMTDHFVTGIGYDANNLTYAIYDTWDQDVHWYQWREMSEDYDWGIFGFSILKIYFDISANVNPTNGGTISGTGHYHHGDIATLTATPKTNYVFVNWTENGTEISTEAQYLFTVTQNRMLVANFQASTPIAVTGVSLDQSNISLVEGNTQQLSATISPANATNQNVTWSSSDNNIATVSATGLVTAVATGNAIITVTTEDGGYTATGSVTVTESPVNMNRYITLTVTNGADIYLDLAADANNTPVKIVSGTNTYNVSVGTDWLGNQTYTADATTMIIYGDIKWFNCNYNYANLTALDPSHNTALTSLSCEFNQLSSLDISHNTVLTLLECGANPLSSLDVSHNTALTTLKCGGNQLSSLDVSHNTALTFLGCSGNQLSSLDVSHNTALTFLGCSGNQLSSLDVSHNTALTWLNCEFNQLSSLDISHNTALTLLECRNNQLNSLDVSYNTALTTLVCYDNPLTTQAIDDIYCALADRTTETEGAIVPADNMYDANHAEVLASNATNARNKNWTVTYGSNYTDIPTTGTYTCPTTVAVTGVSLDMATTTITVGNTQQFIATVTPGNATNQNVNWNSSDNNIATVSSTGLVTAVAEGNATITVTTEDGGYTATCSVEVTAATIAVTGVSVNPSSISLVEGNTQQLTATIAPNNATNQNVTWSSNDNNIATVSPTGLVTAVAAGNTTITVTTEDGGYTADCAITVSSFPVNMNRYITLTVTNGVNIVLGLAADADNTPVKIVSGTQEYNLTVVGPDDMDWGSYIAGASTMTIYGDILDFRCEYNEDKISGLDVSNNTTLTSIICGNNTLSNLDVSGCSILKELHCYNNQLNSLDVSGCSALTRLFCSNNALNSLDVGECSALTLLECHGNAFTTQAIDDIYCTLVDRTTLTEGEIYPAYTTFDPNHANILASNATNARNKNWKVRYRGPHTDILTTGTYACGVAVAVTGVSLDILTAYMTAGYALQLTATIAPNNATNQNVTWSSSDNNIATVSATGLVTAVAAGNATITVTTADGGFTATCAVTVSPATVAVTGVSLDMATATITTGNTKQLIATVEPNNATNQNITWSSSDNSIATVSPTGLVAAVAAGNATITVTTADGGFTDQCAVTVTNATIAVTGVSLDMNSATITAGNAQQLTATVAPNNATNQNVTWSSSDNNIVTVSATGLVTAVAAGNATITVTTVDGGFTDSCAITVTSNVPAVPVSNWAIILGVAIIIGGSLIRFVIKN